MRRLIAATAGLLMTGTTLALGLQNPTAAQPPPSVRQGIVVEPQTGRTLHPHTTDSDYRTGPALTRLSATTVLQHNCGPNSSGPGEMIRHTISYDAGSTWQSEGVTLQGSPAPSPDAAGVCDPAVVIVGGYYYLAYTGTSTAGTKRLYLARSSSGTSSFTKWNGYGWSGGTPYALDLGTAEASGPSLVVKDNTLFLYYTVRITTGPAAGTYLNRVATAPLGTTPTEQAAWPTRLTPQAGNAIEHPGKYAGLDCVGNHWWADTDVKYDEATGRFLAITTDQITVPRAALQAYESTDGLTFTKAVIARGDYRPGARSPGQLADVSGHLVPGAPTAIAYAHSTACGYSDLRLTPTTQRSLTTGAIDQPLTTSAAGWTPLSGNWSINFPAGVYQQSNSTAGLDSATMLTGHALGASSSIQASVRGANYSVEGGWVGVSFSKNHPDDTLYESGYTAILVSPTPASGNAPRLCVLKAGIAVACRDLPDVTWRNVWHEMTIVQSDGAIKVYLDGRNDLSVAYTDPDAPYLGGYLGLTTSSATGLFKNLTAGDNVPGKNYTAADWSTSGSPWTISGNRLQSAHTGQANLQTTIGTPVQLGNGTYTADIMVPSGRLSSDWGGLALTNDGVTGSFGTGGYLVFVRANGNLGIWKAGAGQVVPDVFTGSYPDDGWLRLRVVKTGANFQVYVSGWRTGPSSKPVLNWTDPNPPAWSIGGFGVAHTDAEHQYSEPGVFWNVTYDANNAKWPLCDLHCDD